MRLFRRQALALGLLPLLPRRARAADEPGVDARARWVAGVYAHPAASVDAEWTAYAATEDERWHRLRPRLSAMSEWSTREITPIVPRQHVLFYPFAGPDALTALALFGASRRVILVGLEPIGALPDPAGGERERAGVFARLGSALADVHRLTFFRTQEMASDFRKDGVLGALVATVVRMGGKVMAVEATTTAAAAPEAPRARIDWTTAAGEQRRLDYVQADLSNAGLAFAPGLASMVHAVAPYVTFVKAAMYLPSEARFSRVRQMILDDSAVVVQDDTGIPFRHFDARWAVRLFGRYEPPGAPFEARLQPDLEAAFERRAPRPLPFGIGYHVEPRRSSLLVASKGA